MNHREQMRRRRGVPGDDALTATAPASVELTIERLVLAGVAPGDRYDIADAVRSELARLLAQQSVPPANPAAHERRLDGGRIHIDNGMRAASVGEQIARAIHGSLGLTTNTAGRMPRS